jgi:hypothetical protein
MRDPTVPRVTQILPSAGWLAVYVDADGDLMTDPLVCWALVEYEHDEEVAYATLTTAQRRMGEIFPYSDQSVVGLVSSSGSDVEPAIDADNFLTYLAPGESLSILAAQADAYRAAHSRPADGEGGR